MRIVACMGLVAAGLGVVGCSGPAKRPTPPASGFTAAGDRDASGGAVRRREPLPPTNGLLAGRVIDAFDRQVSQASILVVAESDGKGPAPAPIEVRVDEQGCFLIPGLEPGQAYQLIARVKDGTRIVAAGSTWTRAPNPKLLITVSADYVTPSTPPVPGRPVYPEPKPAPKPEGAKTKDPKSAASIERPAPRQEDDSARDFPAYVPPEGAAPEQPQRPRRDLQINIRPKAATPETGAAVPETPPIPPLPTPPPTAPVTPMSRKTVDAPWCQLFGKKLDDFALLDLDGRTWQYRRDRQGKLVLLDFWHTHCPPCLRAIPHLNALQRTYGRDGLEVIGIACESGSPESQARQVVALRWPNGAPFRFDYRILLWGEQGPRRPCPVASSFCVARYPTLKLLDEDGRIVWESQGLGGSQLNELKREIERRLGVARR